MPFPEFEREKKKILFFSRGRGRGHAVPDIEIIRALGAVRPDADVRIVSYGAGSATFAEFGFPVVDLGLPDTSPIAETSVLAGRLIGWLDPDLVVSHEEFAVAPAAKIFDKPVVFLTDWFCDPDLYSMASLKFADQILFLGRPGIFAEPPWVRGKVRYLGPVLRNFLYGRAERLLARAELEIPQNAFVLSVFPGSWPESETPLLDLITETYDTLDHGSKTLVWVAGRDAALVKTALEGRDALVFESYWRIDRLMAASDVAIAKMNRMTIFELHHLGIPVIGLSWDRNPIDDQAVADLEGVRRLTADTLGSEGLRAAIRQACEQPVCQGRRGNDEGARKCAEAIGAALI